MKPRTIDHISPPFLRGEVTLVYVPEGNESDARMRGYETELQRYLNEHHLPVGATVHNYRETYPEPTVTVLEGATEQDRIAQVLSIAFTEVQV